MLWEIDIHPADGQPDLVANSIRSGAPDLGLADEFQIRTARGYLIEGDFSQRQIEDMAKRLFADPVVEKTVVGQVGHSTFDHQDHSTQVIHVLPKPGVTDAVAESAARAMAELGLPATGIRTFNKFWISNLDPPQIDFLCDKLLANDSIEEVRRGSLALKELGHGEAYQFELQSVDFKEADEEALLKINSEGQLSLNLEELKTIQEHYLELDREPTDIELETIAQTWSEHCSHKTLAGRIEYTDENGTQFFENMLKETIGVSAFLKIMLVSLILMTSTTLHLKSKPITDLQQSNRTGVPTRALAE
jgi:phosphoribosylformylglycinamidine (FGAM) synthase PurS component